MSAVNTDTGALLLGVGATVSQNTFDLTNVDSRGLKLFVNMSLVGTGSITVTVQGKDPTSGTYYTILASAAIVANGFTTYTVYPGAPVTANASVNDILPRTWRVLVTANNANPANYTVSGCLVV